MYNLHASQRKKGYGLSEACATTPTYSISLDNKSNCNGWGIRGSIQKDRNVDTPQFDQRCTGIVLGAKYQWQSHCAILQKYGLRVSLGVFLWGFPTPGFEGKTNLCALFVFLLFEDSLRSSMPLGCSSPECILIHILSTQELRKMAERLPVNGNTMGECGRRSHPWCALIHDKTHRCVGIASDLWPHKR